MAPVVSPDGRFVLYLIDERGSRHVRYSEVSANGTLGPPRRVFKNTPEPDISSPSLAPNGYFLSYDQRQQGGSVEVFMTDFPSGEGRWQISRGGGTRPVWAGEAGELIFVGGMPGGPRTVMAARIQLSPEVVIGAPLKLFDVGKDFSDEIEAAPDAKRFIMIRQRSEGGSEAVR
jgi:Tol biopolymer transport system component